MNDDDLKTQTSQSARGPNVVHQNVGELIQIDDRNDSF
jgi:hypothetical protein